MFAKSKSALLGIALLAGVSAPAAAADLYEPQVVPAPVVTQPVETGGWYIRGDVDYHWSSLRDANYITYGCGGGGGGCTGPGTDDFDTMHLGGAWSLGGGVGYNINHYLRTDLTVDYWGKSKFHGITTGTTCGGGGPCSADNQSGYTAWLLLANAYADLGTYHGITPYIGAGIGGAHIQWDNVVDTNGNANPGAGTWRFAYALMAGASYCLTHNLDLDVGYRFTHVEGGRMFQFANGVGPGYDRGLNVHEVRAGLRYNFGGDDGGRCVEQVAYQPPAPAPVYK
ncbi:MAG: porin [Rhizobiales bacterium 65-79]|jgi:opacity protein-like surface antigen|nr:porin family protein [Hyphomicrobiales bacterium]OJU03187.1 MAG: porin [Rhizobiales bacterium 65-79]